MLEETYRKVKLLQKVMELELKGTTYTEIWDALRQLTNIKDRLEEEIAGISRQDPLHDRVQEKINSLIQRKAELKKLREVLNTNIRILTQVTMLVIRNMKVINETLYGVHLTDKDTDSIDKDIRLNKLVKKLNKLVKEGEEENG